MMSPSGFHHINFNLEQAVILNNILYPIYLII